jgi:hypothetical protein
VASTRRGPRGRVAARFVAYSATTLVLLVVLLPAGSSAGATVRRTGAVSFRAALDGQRLDLSSSGDPIVIDPDRSSTLALELRNPGDQEVIVRQVQIRGKAFGITLMAYDVTINASVPANDRVNLEVPVEFVDLGQQADGLLPATIRLVSPARTELASQNFTVDVRGSASSLMAIFTIVVAIGTGLSMLTIWIAIGRRSLPPNRLRRGLRLGVTGAGVGVTLTLFLSEILLVTPKGSVWIPLLLVPALGALVLGYLSPGPLAIDEGEDEVEDWMRATGQ